MEASTPESVMFTEEDINTIITFTENNPSIKLKANKNTKKKLESLFNDLATKLGNTFTVTDLKLKVEELEEDKKRELLQFEEAVISYYQENPILYNHGLEQYKEQHLKNRLIKSLAVTLKWSGSPITEDLWTSDDRSEIERKATEIQGTWKALKAKYTKEKKRESSSLGTGKGTNQVYVSIWVHMASISFLDDLEEIPTSSDVLTESEPDTQTESKRGRYERSKRDDGKEQQKNQRWTALMDAIKDSSPKQAETEVNDEDRWGLSIEKSIVKLNPLNEELAKAEIQKVIATFLKNETLKLPPPEFQVINHPVALQQQSYSSPNGHGLGPNNGNKLYYGNVGQWNLQGNVSGTSPMSSNCGVNSSARRELNQIPGFGPQIMDATNLLYNK